MGETTDEGLKDIATTLSALLRALHVLEFVGRHLDPEQLPDVLQAVGTPDDALRAALADFDPGERQEDAFIPIRTQIARAADAALAGFDGLRAAVAQMDIRGAYRALRRESLALETLYPLTTLLSPVDAFFLEEDQRADIVLREQLATPAAHTGVIHAENASGQRGGFSLYVPENYRPETAHNLIVALHGGSGHGRQFLWNWVRIARSRGLIVVAPTAIGSTWALAGPDMDSPNIQRILDFVRARWNIAPDKLLLTGMSDGGSFTLLSGLQSDSPFTHLAPFAAGFHPLMAEMADGTRARGLPIYLVHGALDWMFPVELAQTAQRMLTFIGTRLTYREVPDLAHVYPRDENAALLDWFLDTPR